MAPVRNSDGPSEAVRISDSTALAATLFDQVLKDCGLESGDVAQLCGVGLSTVHKWRSVNEDRSPSLVQLLLLPPKFWLAFHRVMNRRYGFGAAAIRRLLDVAGELALGIE